MVTDFSWSIRDSLQLIWGASKRAKKEEVTIPVLRKGTKDMLQQLLQEANFVEEKRELGEAAQEAMDTLEEAGTRLLAALHLVSKTLRFWELKAQATPGVKMRVMVLERGPWAFFVTVARTACHLALQGSSGLALADRAAARISERVNLLSELRSRLASALGQVYTAAEELAGQSGDDRWQAALPSVLLAVHQGLKVLEDSYQLPQSDYPEAEEEGAATLVVLRFDDHAPGGSHGRDGSTITTTTASGSSSGSGSSASGDPRVAHASSSASARGRGQAQPQGQGQKEQAQKGQGQGQGGQQQGQQGQGQGGRKGQEGGLEAEIRGARELLRRDLLKLHDCLELLMMYYGRPRTLQRRWVQYSGAAVGLAVVSGWLVRHSQLAGSDDLERWIGQGRESASVFLREHALTPLMAIRDELLVTFRERPHGMTELEEVRLTSESLRRMLVAFAETTGGKVLPPDTPDQALMEMVMHKYEKELMHPLQSLLGGELARALLIQVQKLKLDIETAMLELDQILRANEINFAVLAALPALLLAIGLGSLTRQFYLYKGRGREGRGRAAHLQRRLLMIDVDRAVMACHVTSDRRAEGVQVRAEQAGLLVYALHRLYRAVHYHARALGEWDSLRADILEVAQSTLTPKAKLHVTARMERMYESLAPVPRP